MKITPTSLEVFLYYAKDAINWSGHPMFDGPKQEKGNLTQLKKAKLIETEVCEDNIVWIYFTDEGKKLALEHGIDIAEYEI